MVSTRPALERMYNAQCNILVKSEVQSSTTKRTSFTESALVSNQPCKLSFETIKQTTENSDAAEVTQLVKLFISPDIVIPPGCKITVTQHGRTKDYQSSGEPAVYTNHQEVVLELFKGWA